MARRISPVLAGTLAAIALVSAVAFAQSSNLLRWFGPATGVLVGTAGSPQTRVATASDLAALSISGTPTTGHCAQFASATTFSDAGAACGGGGGGGGTVTSVALTVPSGFSVSGSPVTSSGTLAISGGPYVRLGQATASGTPASITVSGISGSYTNLEIVVTGRSTASASAEDMLLQFNSDTGSNYDSQSIQGVGTGVSAVEHIGSTSIVMGGFPAGTAPSTRAATARALVANYTNTTWDKTTSGTAGFTFATGSGGNVNQTWNGVWRPSTPAAITSVTISAGSGNLVNGSQLTVYGLQ